MEHDNSIDPSKFTPRDHQNVKGEHTGERTTEYSLWHRSLGSKYLTLDIDFVEYRKDRGIVAIVAVTGRLNNEKHIINAKNISGEELTLKGK